MTSLEMYNLPAAISKHLYPLWLLLYPKNTFCRSELKFPIVVGSQVWPTSTAKHSKFCIIWCLVSQKCQWNCIVITRLGNQFIRYDAVENASSQNFSGIPAWASKVSPVSTICLCFLSIIPFCWCVCGQETRYAIPFSLKYLCSF